ncbi:DNA-directed RNA polymerase subunit alpha [Rubellicoccus peritrichatus]|uniref:DNA-directed RNA polymerase subunit alpha n=1 Tax=Rubellicoccus peritrichatus TaxID=3080537 RepID=A0AAQ3LGL7_9BACT|nr:DNA-directed RNA polymerase subunit alpha [Puniceicoccus sp. CR14]WOO43510.1 DNA-directed RNA polymerase subunit alpha [Puniceicoccus sp. CR14]
MSTVDEAPPARTASDSSPKRLGKFELPKRLVKDEETSTATYAKFTAEPFETGYGHTIGNSLRRILLSSIEGAAISSVKIDGVDHEFQSIEGIVEDVTDVVLNLKKVLMMSHKREPVRLLIDVDKEGEVTAADIQQDANIEVLNPEQVICTLDKKRRFVAELEVKVGRGYRPAEENKREEQVIGLIPIDSLFSPVRIVKYSVQNTRVGQMTDYDKLVLEVHTDGRVNPDAALKEAAAILRHHLDAFDEVSREKIEFESESKEISEEQNRLRKLLNMSVNEIELSVRAANCLNNANITTVGELAMKSEQEMLKYRNFGKKSLNEIKAKLEQLGLSLGMKLDERLLDRGLD